MILSEFSNFCDDEVLAVTAGAETFEGKSLDLGAATPGDIGVGEPLYFVVQAATNIRCGANTGTLEIRLVSDDQATIVPADAVEHYVTTIATTTTATNAGDYLAVVQLPREGTAYKEFLGVTCKPVGEDLAASTKINAFLTKDAPKIKAYADGAPALIG